MLHNVVNEYIRRLRVYSGINLESETRAKSRSNDMQLDGMKFTLYDVKAVTGHGILCNYRLFNASYIALDRTCLTGRQNAIIQSN